VFSITGTASGQLYAAYLGDAARPLYEAERQAAAGAMPTWDQFDRDTLAEVRAQGLSRSEGAVVPGVSALSAPVFDHRGAIVLALTAIGPSAAFDSTWRGALAGTLRDAAAMVSARLGHPAGVKSGHV
jgi:DNA-binding IclR family transcriptional regulator